MKKFALAVFLGSLVFCAYAQDAMVAYSANVSGSGWVDYVTDGDTAGTAGRQSRPFEALRIAVVGPVTGDIEYQVRAQDRPQGWKKNGDEAAGNGRSLEAVQVRLTGQLARQYDVEYRINAQNTWQPWVKNGDEAGAAAGRGPRVIEAIEIILVEKSSGKRGRPQTHRR